MNEMDDLFRKTKNLTAKQSLFNRKALELSFYWYNIDEKRNRVKKFKWSFKSWVKNIWYWFKTFIILYTMPKRIHIGKYLWEVSKNGHLDDEVVISNYDYYNHWDEPGFDWTEMAVAKGVFVGWTVAIYSNGN